MGYGGFLLSNMGSYPDQSALQRKPFRSTRSSRSIVHTPEGHRDDELDWTTAAGPRREAQGAGEGRSISAAEMELNRF
jgi:hypothetical protein